MALGIVGRRGQPVGPLPAAARSGPSGPRVEAPESVGHLDPASWRLGLPTLSGAHLWLRELDVSDTPHLLNLLNEGDVSKFLTPPPRTPSGFRRFVRWTHRRRAEGRYACFAVVPRATDAAAGFFQLRAVEAGVATAEWGFVIGRPYWGTGLFAEGADLLLSFAFEQMALSRIEARAVAANGRANGALRKLGAVQEGVLRQAVSIDGRHYDTTLWSILEADWRGARRAPANGRTLGSARIQARIQ
ncbi:MAG: GNAT family N-acetyltransferase [Acidobacteriota bacterium]|nr:GNAT family N-acetyltransferase [Acidobacteriota bacterium]